MSQPNEISKDDPEAPSLRDTSSTFSKGLAVLRAFDESRHSLTLAEIAQITGFDRASARRLMLTLVRDGYAVKVDRHFALSSRVLNFAGSYLRTNRFGSEIQPILNRFSAQLGFAVSLALPDGDHAIYAAQSSLDNSAVSLGFTIGSRLPLMHTSIGRMVLAYSDPNWATAQIRDAPLVQYTQASVMDRDEIAQAVNVARTEGAAVVCGEFEAGATGFATPVGAQGQLRAVVGASIHGAKPDQYGGVLDVLRHCAASLARIIHRGWFLSC